MAAAVSRQRNPPEQGNAQQQARTVEPVRYGDAKELPSDHVARGQQGDGEQEDGRDRLRHRQKSFHGLRSAAIRACRRDWPVRPGTP
ncbi:hypothetical protein SDC9_129053 [bioreactor metagenome]|uniref:Uncharacterized protein n=1 Tax=bioreactor metagenome TaxID=1076179 RepID=A0A645CYN7_9ZZZZ